jgi:hypothetical protein
MPTVGGDDSLSAAVVALLSTGPTSMSFSDMAASRGQVTLYKMGGDFEPQAEKWQ